MEEERRQEPRQSILRSGIVLLKDRAVDCTVKNLSARGALLEFRRTVIIPDVLDWSSNRTWLDGHVALSGARICRWGSSFSPPLIGLINFYSRIKSSANPDRGVSRSDAERPGRKDRPDPSAVAQQYR
jgi:hypothetical protein